MGPNFYYHEKKSYSNMKIATMKNVSLYFSFRCNVNELFLLFICNFEGIITFIEN